MIKIIDYWAPWCGPCQMLKPVIEEVEKEFADKVEVEKVNVDEDGTKAAEFGVMGIPTLIFLKNGKEVGRKSGFIPKEELVKLISSF